MATCSFCLEPFYPNGPNMAKYRQTLGHNSCFNENQVHQLSPIVDELESQIEDLQKEVTDLWDGDDPVENL